MLNDLVAALRAQPANSTAQVALARALVKAGNLAGLREMLGFVHQATGAGMEAAHNAGVHLATAAPADYAAAIAAYPASCPFRGPLMLTAGYGLAMLYDLDGAARLIRGGFRQICEAQCQIAGLDMAPVTYACALKSAVLLEPASYPAAARMTELTGMAGRLRESRYVCAAAGDSRYFCAYGPELAASLSAVAEAALVLVVIDPDAEAVETARAIAARHPGCAILAHAYGGDKLAEYSTSLRFLAANRLLETFGRPLVLMDIDSAIPPDAGEVLAAIAGLGLCHQHRPVSPPYLIAEACVMAAHPGEAARRFFADAAGFIHAKMAETAPLWHVDQAALHRAVALAKGLGEPVVDLLAHFAGRIELPAYFKKDHKIAKMERATSRTDMMLKRPFTVSPEGRPLFG